MRTLLIVLSIFTFLTINAFTQENTTDNQPQPPQTDTTQVNEGTSQSNEEVKLKLSFHGKISYRFQYGKTKRTPAENASFLATEEDETKELNMLGVYFGTVITAGPRVRGGIELATGVPQVHYNNLGNYADLKFIRLLKAYIWLGLLKNNMLEINLGKFSNPMFSAGLLFVDEIKPEGLHQRITFKTGSSKLGLNLLEFVYDDEQTNYSGGGNKNVYSHWILGAQFFWIGEFNKIKITVAEAIYAWTHRDNDNSTIANYEQELIVFNSYLEVVIKLGKLPLAVKGEFVYNIATPDNVNNIPGADYMEKHRFAFLVEISLGKVKKLYDWKIKVGYLRAKTYALDYRMANYEFYYLDFIRNLKIGIYFKGTIVLLPFTRLSIDFLYFDGNEEGYDVGIDNKYERKGWKSRLTFDLIF